MIFEIKQDRKEHHSAIFSAIKNDNTIGRFSLTGKFGSKDMNVTGAFIDTPFFMSPGGNVKTEQKLRPYIILNGIKPIGMISHILSEGFVTNNFIYNEIELNNKIYSQYSVALGPGDIKLILYENKKQVALIEKSGKINDFHFKVYAENKTAAMMSIISLIYVYITSIYKPDTKTKEATFLFSSPLDRVLAEKFDNEFKKTVKE